MTLKESQTFELKELWRDEYLKTVSQHINNQDIKKKDPMIKFNIDKFFEMEEKFSLFDYKPENGFPIWDILRYEVMMLNFANNDIPLYTPYMSYSLKNIVYMIARLVKSSFSFIFVRPENIVFLTSRFRDEHGKRYDKAAQNIIDELSDKCLVVEKMKPASKYKNKAEFDFIMIYNMFFKKKNMLPSDFYKLVYQAITATFGQCDFTYPELDRIYSQYLREYNYYRFYLKWKKPKRIFNNGGPYYKAKLSAATSLKIKTYELQHGYLTDKVLGYSYPAFIDQTSPVIVPDCFLTIGEFWSSQLHNPSTFVSVGNDFYNISGMAENKDNSILIVSSNLYVDHLTQLAITLSQINNEIPIIYKVRPSENCILADLKKRFLSCPNIKIVYDEVDMYMLIERSSLVVMVNSTAFFEAMHLGAQIAIYKIIDYNVLSNYFNCPNVHLFDTAYELLDIYAMKKEKYTLKVFEKFNSNKFKEIIKI
jgi:hypothetical protein